MQSSTTSSTTSNSIHTLSTDDSDAKKFNTNLIQLFEQLKKVYPEDKDIYIYTDKIKLVTKANFKLPSQMFLMFCEKYIKALMLGEEDFFLQFDYREHLTADPKYLKLIEKIISIWKETASPKLKDTIKDYMKILLALAVKCMRRTDLLDEINKYRDIPLKF